MRLCEAAGEEDQRAGAKKMPLLCCPPRSRKEAALSPARPLLLIPAPASPPLPKQMNPLKKFDPQPPSSAWKAYAVTQFMINLLSVGAYLQDAALAGEIQSYAGLEDMDKFWFDSMLAFGISAMVLWAFCNVSSIMTLGVKGTTSTRGSILRGEGLRHGVFAGLPLVAGVVKAGTATGQGLMYFAAAYAALAVIMLWFVRNEPERGGGGGGDEAGKDLVVALMAEERGEERGKEREELEVAKWTWYGASKYR